MGLRNELVEFLLPCRFTSDARRNDELKTFVEYVTLALLCVARQPVPHQLMAGNPGDSIQIKCEVGVLKRGEMSSGKKLRKKGCNPIFLHTFYHLGDWLCRIGYPSRRRYSSLRVTRVTKELYLQINPVLVRLWRTLSRNYNTGFLPRQGGGQIQIRFICPALKLL